jgi:RNA polymerase subunit RPABC4/transcription elongation factor Spt4
VTDASIRQCPNCGSTRFVHFAPNRRECAYCGTLLELPRRPETAARTMIRCVRCGTNNEPDARYCASCGATLSVLLWGRGRQLDPAVLSLLVTVVGSMFVPLGGAILGLILGYRALREARAGEDAGQGKRMATIAVTVGWLFIAFSVVPLCIGVASWGVPLGFTVCEGLFGAVSDMLTGGR